MSTQLPAGDTPLAPLGVHIDAPQVTGAGETKAGRPLLPPGGAARERVRQFVATPAGAAMVRALCGRLLLDFARSLAAEFGVGEALLECVLADVSRELCAGTGAAQCNSSPTCASQPKG